MEIHEQPSIPDLENHTPDLTLKEVQSVIRRYSIWELLDFKRSIGDEVNVTPAQNEDIPSDSMLSE